MTYTHTYIRKYISTVHTYSHLCFRSVPCIVVEDSKVNLSGKRAGYEIIEIWVTVHSKFGLWISGTQVSVYLLALEIIEKICFDYVHNVSKSLVQGVGKLDAF